MVCAEFEPAWVGRLGLERELTARPPTGASSTVDVVEQLHTQPIEVAQLGHRPLRREVVTEREAEP